MYASYVNGSRAEPSLQVRAVRLSLSDIASTPCGTSSRHITQSSLSLATCSFKNHGKPRVRSSSSPVGPISATAAR